MKISYRTHPVLEKLEKNSLLQLFTIPSDLRAINLFIDDFRQAFKVNSNSYATDVKYLTKPFLQAFENAKSKLCIPELIERTITQSGTFLFEKNAICFSIINNANSVSINFFVFVENILFAYADMVASDENDGNQFYWTSSTCGIDPNNKQALQQDLDHWLLTILLLVNFLKYAEVETKNLAPKSSADVIFCRYINQTKSKIQIINSTWFTTLVKSDAFKVRGHFRLQPKKKDGEWTKELIWINDFEKTGYTSPAKKEQLQSINNDQY